jgi:preprotein translocase subunit SecA
VALLRLLGRFINLLAQTFSRVELRDLNRLQVIYGRMDDEQLRAELSRFLLTGPAPRSPQAMRWRWLSRYQDSPALHALAIGVCLFNRHPCDLPEGSAAYAEQKLAALMLIEGTNVQMETGEGKTYAIALAATALLTAHPQVIVITVNDYLAQRDRARVSRYFQAAGLACQYGLPDPAFRGIAYTTMVGLSTGYLQRTYPRYDSTLPDYPAHAAVIIDEIDSVLLDQPLERDLVRSLPSEESLWENVFRLVNGWDERRFTYDPVSDDFSLTADAWEEVTQLGHEIRKPASVLMQLASAALWARQAEEGHHYLVEDGIVHLINQVTGEAFDNGGAQQSALDYLIAGRNPPVNLTIAETNGLTLLKRHPSVVGLSGTARDDTLYYLQQLGTLTAQVVPRFERYASKAVTLLAESREIALQYVAQRIEETRPRPVVIGTWSPAVARAVADRLRRAGVVTEHQLGVITAFDSLADAAVLEVAGEPGRVTVLSQGGSRGVDVRSTHRPLLLVLGRAVEPRLDRQFLGRVGRHGEPFDAEFIIDPSSPVRIPVRLVTKIAGEEIMPLEGVAARAFSQAQRDVWVYRTRRRQQATVLSSAIGDVEATVASEFSQLRRLRSEASLSEYIAELCVEPAADGGHASQAEHVPGAGLNTGAAGGGADAGAVRARVLAAVQRRKASDSVVARFEAAVRATVGAAAESYEFRDKVPGEPREIAALTRWLTEGLSLVEPGADEARAALFRRQAAEAANQRLPARTTPHDREPADVIYETRLLANAALIAQTRQRLASLRVSSSRDAYFRRSAFTARNLHKLSELSVQQETLSNLSMVDRPALLDELYYSHDYQIFEPRPNDEHTQIDAPPATAPAIATLTEAKAEAAVAEFLDSREQEPGGLAIPRETARLLLLDVMRPLMAASSLMSTTILRQRVRLLLDSLAAKGTRGGKLRDHRRLIFDFADSLYHQGILKERLTRESAVISAIRRAASYVGTIPRFGIGAMLVYLAVMAIGVLPVAAQARHSGFTDLAIRVFGFQATFPDRPFLAYFAILITIQAAGRACGLADPSILVARIAPVLALAISLIFYNRGFANLGWTVLLIVTLTLWSAALVTANRFIVTLVGIDANAILAATSVAVYLVAGMLNGQGRANLFVAIGILAVVAGPTVPVSIGSLGYARARFKDADDRARVRVGLDPAATSGLAAFVVVTVVARVHGNLAAAGFVVMQVLAFALIAGRRLGTGRIKGMLAKLQVGTPLTDEGLTSYLRRALLRSTMIAAMALSGALVVSTLAGGLTPTEFLLQEWAGIILLTGALSAGSALSVGGGTMPLLPPSEDDTSTLTRLREQLRAWRRMRFWWVWRTAVLGVLIFGILRWISDWIGVVDVAHAIGRWIQHLVS